ncbi:MAG: hypothetical protein WBJ21_03720 [Burkholderiaceae bacterium]
MSTDVITIKQVPQDLKAFWSEQAKANDRSMNRELIRLLDSERKRLLGLQGNFKNFEKINAVVKAVHALPSLDDRPVNDILYDDLGMTK